LKYSVNINIINARTRILALSTGYSYIMNFITEATWGMSCLAIFTFFYLVKLMINSRKQEKVLLSAIGMSKKTIRNIFTTEYSSLFLIILSLSLFLGFALSILMLWQLGILLGIPIFF